MLSFANERLRCTTPSARRVAQAARLVAQMAFAVVLFTVAACSKPQWVGYPEELPALESAPSQENVESELLDVRAGFRITKVARYAMTARVLGVETYRWDAAADVAPVDLALAWGPVADPWVVSQLKVTQGGRWYHWRTRSSQWPLPRREIEKHSANVHIVPEGDEVLTFVRSLEPGEVVTLEGWLVDLTAEDGSGDMKTSTTRNDTGAGACEILYVTAARRALVPQ
jgi:hypothetical protein